MLREGGSETEAKVASNANSAHKIKPAVSVYMCGSAVLNEKRRNWRVTVQNPRGMVRI